MDEFNALKAYFLFDDEDLAANRAGKFSSGQQKQIAENIGFANHFILWLGLVLVVAAVLVPALSLGQKFPAILEHLNSAVAGTLIFPLVCFFVMGGLGGRLIYRSIVEKPMRQVTLKNSTGRAKLVGERFTPSENHEDQLEYKLHVGRDKFDVDEGAHGLIIDGDRYTVYFYTQKDDPGNYVLSVEHLSSQGGTTIFPDEKYSFGE